MLGKGRARRVEHRVVSGADGGLQVTGGEEFCRHRGAIAGLIYELLGTGAHLYSSPSRSPPARTILSRLTSWKKKLRIWRRLRSQSAS